MNDDPEWFAPKLYGFGAGLPISWQGWAVTIGFLALITFLSVMFAHAPIELIGAIAPVIVVFMVITARTTRGGWKWRWGKDE